jgi:hypothetical protein
MDLKALIAKQRQELETPKTETLNVVLAGELVEVRITKLMPDDWQQLVATHPPRVGIDSDGNLGFDQATLPRDYLATHIQVAGEDIETETWTEMFGLLDSVHRNNIGTVVWGLNVYAAVKELRELGKARADQESASHGNRASRHAASKAGSPRPSRSTSTTTKTTPTE